MIIFFRKWQQIFFMSLAHSESLAVWICSKVDSIILLSAANYLFNLTRECSFIFWLSPRDDIVWRSWCEESLLNECGFVAHNGDLWVIVKILVVWNASNLWQDNRRQEFLSFSFLISERFFLMYLEHAILVDRSDFFAFFISHSWEKRGTFVLIVISVFKRAHFSNHFALLLLHYKLTDDRVVVTHDAVLSADFI